MASVSVATSRKDLKSEVLRLRRKERLSLNDIVTRVSVPKSTAQYWLKAYPLTAEEKKARSVSAGRYSAPKKALPSGRSLRDMVRLQNYSPLEIGNICESAVVHRLCINRCKVLQSMHDGDTVDLYALRGAGKKTVKIQVRSARSQPRYGLPIISLRRSGNGKVYGFKPGDFDILVGYCMATECAYVFTFDEVSAKTTSVTVTKESAEAWDKLEAML